MNKRRNFLVGSSEARLPGKICVSPLAATVSILSLLISPYFIIAMAALSHFPPVFGFAVLPVLVAGSIFLCWRLLLVASDRTETALMLLAKCVSLAATLIFFVLVSGFNLLTEFERFGLACIIFVDASILILPLALIRQSTLELLLNRLPGKMSISALTVIFVLSGFAAIAYLVSQSTFI